MLRGGKLNLPDPLGSFVAFFEDKSSGDTESDRHVFDCGEELEAVCLKGLGLGKHGDDGEEAQVKARQRLQDRPVSSLVSVSEILAADENRSDLEHQLSQEEINLEKLQRIGSLGLPDEGSLRATTWKLLLGYLSPSRNLWERELTENRSKYAILKEELLSSPSEIKMRKEAVTSVEQHVDSAADGLLERQEISNEDHPLSLGPTSAWNHYFKDTDISEQIDRDLQRTHPDMQFFSGHSLSGVNSREAMRNILLLFAKLNPAVRYVQGMNEVLSPIYFVFSTATDEQVSENAEADSFFCFVRLLSDNVDHFCKQLDDSSVGINSTLSRLMGLLKANDEELWRHLEFKSKVTKQMLNHISMHSGGSHCCLLRNSVSIPS